MMWFPIVVFLVLHCMISAQHVRYVKPDDYSLNCPGQPCLTLQQYATEPFITGTMFKFLSGNHSLLTRITLQVISNITFTAEVSDTVKVLCRDGCSIWCSYTNFIMERLIFILGPSEEEHAIFAILHGSVVLMNSSSIQRNGILVNSPQIIYIRRSTLKVESCLFEMNSARSGGVIYSVESSNITISNSAFIANLAYVNGGAIFTITSTLVITNSIFSENRAGHDGGAVSAQNSTITVSGSRISDDQGFFQKLSNNKCMIHNVASMMNNVASMISSEVSSATSEFIHSILATLSDAGSVCFHSNEANDSGGAMFISDSSITFSESVLFYKNSAADGGALKLTTVNMNAQHLICMNNSAMINGGAIFASDSSLLRFGTTVRGIVNPGTSLFYQNRASAGGALLIISGVTLTISGSSIFLKNEAYRYNGGAIKSSARGMINLPNGKTIFEQNSAAEDGGGIDSTGTIINGTSLMLIQFIGNSAGQNGGGLSVKRDYIHHPESLWISAYFRKNKAGACGGAVYVRVKNIEFENITAIWNTGSAVCVSENSNVKFIGPTDISFNTGRMGGGLILSSKTSAVTVSFIGLTTFHSNRATVGGAIYSLYETTLKFTCSAYFGYNSANEDGGALYALGTRIIFGSENCTRHCFIKITHNSAENGGALYLDSTSSLTFFGSSTQLNNNLARRNGGVIFHQDAGLASQCNYDGSSEKSNLPFCFIRLHHCDNFQLYYHNNSANGRENFLYGGLLDRCSLQKSVHSDDYMYDTFLGLKSTSQPYQLCFCENNEAYNCSGKINVKVFRGQKFSLFLLALDQERTPISTQVYSTLRSTARFLSNQRSQNLYSNCTTLSYNLYSTEDSEELILYPDGPCQDTGLARAIVNVTFWPCPDGFSKYGEKCDCEKRLLLYGANCTIDNNDTISKSADVNFWVGALYENGTYEGLILCETCPIEYCKSGSISFSLDSPDMQCANNRSGMLCGACAANYSLMFGSSQCEECSNTYLALLPPFAAVGIALVAFLSLLRLTVATGMINSVILYANIVQANRHLFFKPGARNILTTFIAWLNLDLGFKTCFYHGMDAYSQTWLQFTFPIFLWSLICLVILMSRYSITFSKLIGRNPMAVLATLLLMSYTKILMIVINVYSSVKIELPNNRTLTVWLSDGNVLYLQSKHLFLTVVTSLVFLFLFLPYTLLLLLGYRLHRFSGRKYLHWLTRLKPLLDSYYAPYKSHTRYWTGFLLLVRCILYIVFSYNPLGATSKSLLAIIIAFTSIGFGLGLILFGRIYNNIYANIIEMSIYLNLILICVFTLAKYNSPAIVYSLVGVVFATMIGIIVYHFHVTYTARLAIWHKFKTMLAGSVAIKHSKSTAAENQNSQLSSHDPEIHVSKTVIELREPLLENSN